MEKEKILDNIQKLVLCGRAMLDAMEELTTLYMTAEVPNADGVESSSISNRFPEASGKLGHSADSPLSSQTRSAGLCDEGERVKSATLEEVRALLAEKSRSGFRAEVKALLTAHGVHKLSDISDPKELGALMAEAQEIGA